MPRSAFRLRLRFAVPLIAMLLVAGPRAPWLLGTIEDNNLSETSGLAPSRILPGLFWALNDSGNAPILFALDATGKSLGRVRLQGTQNRDWEALASGPCPTDMVQRHCLYVADIGDNEAKRDLVRIDILPEPSPNSGRHLPARTHFFTYEGGPRDAEAIMVHPVSGRIFIADKVGTRAAPNGSGLFEVLGSGATARAVRVGDISRITLGGQIAVSRLTDGAFMPDGSGLVLRDLRHVYRTEQQDGRISLRIVDATPFVQAEALAITPNGQQLVLTSEGRNAPVRVVGLK